MPDKPPFLTYEVAASAYPPSFWAKHDADSGHVALYTHAVNPVTDQPFCNRIKRRSLLDDGALITTLPPTCPACLAKLRKLGLLS